MNITSAKFIKEADGYFPPNGAFETSDCLATVNYTQQFDDDTVVLGIEDQIFSVGDLKELRKFLKLLIEQAS